MTPNLLDALASPGYWIAALATVLLVALTVGIHFEGLDWLSRSMPRWRVARRLRVMLLMYCLIALHTLEIWAFGIGIFGLVQLTELDGLRAAEPLQLLDAVYLSASTYTTVGYGDLVPQGAMRLVMASEALAGFVMITWSASFTYLEMEWFWRPQRFRRLRSLRGRSGTEGI